MAKEPVAADVADDFKTQPGDWNLILHKLQTTHKLSIEKVCDILQCSRVWVNQFIMPFMTDRIKLSRHYTFLANNELADGICNKQEIKHVNLCNATFEKHIKDNISLISRQTIILPISRLMNKKDKKEFYKVRKLFEKNINLLIERIDELEEKKIDADKDYIDFLSKEQKKLRKAIDKIITDNIELIAQTISISGFIDARPYMQKRGQVERYEIEYDKDKIDVYNLHSVHSLTRHGHNELVHRRIFMSGAIRIELNIESKDGKLSKKNYYFNEEWPELENKYDVHVLLIYNDAVADLLANGPS